MTPVESVLVFRTTFGSYDMENTVPQEDEAVLPIPVAKVWRLDEYFELVLNMRPSHIG